MLMLENWCVKSALRKDVGVVEKGMVGGIARLVR